MDASEEQGRDWDVRPARVLAVIDRQTREHSLWEFVDEAKQRADLHGESNSRVALGEARASYDKAIDRFLV